MASMDRLIACLAHDKRLAPVHPVRPLQVRQFDAKSQRHPGQCISALHDIGVERPLFLRAITIAWRLGDGDSDDRRTTHIGLELGVHVVYFCAGAAKNTSSVSYQVRYLVCSNGGSWCSNNSGNTWAGKNVEMRYRYQRTSK